MSTQERRKFPRTRLNIPLELTFGEQTITSRILDISTSGIRFRTAEALPLMSRVQLAIELGEGTGAPLALSGVVVRSDPNADASSTDESADPDDETPDDETPEDETPEDGGHAYETAIFFDDLTDKMNRQLTQFLATKER